MPDRQSDGAVSTLLIGACSGPPTCTGLHTCLYVDGVDMITWSDLTMVGLGARRLLRPGGPLYPTDMPRKVDVAAQWHPEPGPRTLTIRVRLRGDTVIWSDLEYQGPDGRFIEEARFHLTQYVGEVERAYAALADRTWPGT